MAIKSNNLSADQTDNSLDDDTSNEDNAVSVIRQKLDRLYSEEPSAAAELSESESAPTRSKHQQFMHELNSAGKDLATVQTEWHNYYQALPDHEKHQVWQEFYSSQPAISAHSAPAHDPQNVAQHKQQAVSSGQSNNPQNIRRQKLRDVRSSKEVKDAIKDKVSAGGKLGFKQHFQSILFGLSMGSVVLIIFLFGFFNEIIIAPFIQPSRANADTPIIIGSSSVAPTSTPEVIIPKINVQIPVNFSETSTDENSIENDLQGGVVHYPTTSVPGQNGNSAFFGHSSNNIFNKGKYKFAFVLLHTMVNGDTFYITYANKVYIYKVISHNIVPPSDVSVLYPVVGQTATATLITCDPPGTSINRLVVVGQQISPDPANNSAAGTAAASSSNSSNLPSDGPSLWSKFIKSILGKLLLFTAVSGIIMLISKKVWKPLLSN